MGKVEIKRKNRLTMISLYGRFDEKLPEELLEEVSYLIQGPRNVIVNAHCLESIGNPWLETFTFFDDELNAKKKGMQFVYFPNEVKKASGQETLLSSFRMRDALAEAMNQLGERQESAPHKHFIKAFVDATIRTMFVQGKTFAKRGALYIKEEDKNHLLGDVAGIVNVMSDTYPYAVILSFPEKTFLKLVSIILKEEYTQISKENQDAVTEMMNIIYGQAKVVLNEQDAGIRPKIPVLNVGRECSGLKLDEGNAQGIPLESGQTVVVPFSCEFGDFFIEVWVPAHLNIKEFFS